MKIEFGIWDHFEARPGLSFTEQYAQKIELLREAEALGFYCYHLAEHHLSSLDLSPSPNVFLAALAQATTKLHMGTMVHILPLYHPVRLVQEFCMLDNLSGGRFEFGIGRGTRAVEHEWYGIDPAEVAERNEEVMKILVSAMTSGNIAYQGKFYNIPDAPMAMLPIQRPYPPIWYAGTPDFPGRRGINFFTRALKPVQRYWELYDETRDQGGHLNPQQDAPWVGVTKHVVVRETEAEAIAVARRAWPFFIEHWHATSTRQPGGKVAPPQKDDFDSVLADGARLLVGTPKTIRDFLERFLEGIPGRPTFYFAPAVQWGDISQAEALESMQMLATEVFPAFRSVPASVKSTVHV